MNIDLDLKPSPLPFKSEKTIFKFISTLYSLKAIKTLSSKNQLVPGLKERRAKLISKLNNETYQKIVYPKLGIKSTTDEDTIANKQAITLRYAKILKQYKPDNSGGLLADLNYFKLVKIIREVFKEHLRGNGDIAQAGIAISVKRIRIYAKVDAENVYMLIKTGTFLGQGSSGTVDRIFEIATKQFLALKSAHLHNPSSAAALRLEIANLKKIHQLINSSSIKFDGMQDPIVVDFDLPKKNLVSYLSSEYDIDLITWLGISPLSNLERITICKTLMQYFTAMDKLDIWHGDIKPDNIMRKNNHLVIIDWTGALLYREAAEQFSFPLFYTRFYCNRIDFLNLQFLRNKQDHGLSNEFIRSAKSLELFTIAITLYMVLTSKMPFKEQYEPDLGFVLPQTNAGMNMLNLTNKNYNPEIISLMEKMLAHDPADRYLIEEAAIAWEKVTL